METLEIVDSGITFAKKFSPSEAKENTTTWLSDPNTPLQGSCMSYDKDKKFRAHKHLMNPRHQNYTQEAFIVIDGNIEVDIYNDSKFFIGSLQGKKGDIIFLWKGYHSLRFLEKSLVYEVKAGALNVPLYEEKEYLYEDNF